MVIKYQEQTIPEDSIEDLLKLTLQRTAEFAKFMNLAPGDIHISFSNELKASVSSHKPFNSGSAGKMVFQASIGKLTNGQSNYTPSNAQIVWDHEIGNLFFLMHYKARSKDYQLLTQLTESPKTLSTDLEAPDLFQLRYLLRELVQPAAFIPGELFSDIMSLVVSKDPNAIGTTLELLPTDPHYIVRSFKISKANAEKYFKDHSHYLYYSDFKRYLWVVLKQALDEDDLEKSQRVIWAAADALTDEVMNFWLPHKKQQMGLPASVDSLEEYKSLMSGQTMPDNEVYKLDPMSDDVRQNRNITLIKLFEEKMKK
jgi:hypothetical protein